MKDIRKFWPVVLIFWLVYETISRHIQNSDLQETFKTELQNTVSKHERQIEVLGAGISIDNQQKRAILIVESIINKINPSLKQEDAFNFAKTIVEESKKYSEIDYLDLTSLITQESSFNPKAKSGAGAGGLGGLMSEAAQFACERLRIPYTDSCVFNPITNIRLTAYYISWCISDRKDRELGYAQYNGGQRMAWRYSCLRKKMNNKMLDSLEEIGLENLADETRNYFPAIQSRINKYAEIAANFCPKDSTVLPTHATTKSIHAVYVAPVPLNTTIASN